MSPTKPADDRPPSPLTAATQALSDATAALGEALKAVTAETTGTVEHELSQGLRSAARTVESMAAKLSGRGSRRDRTRQDLVAAATTVFAARGYDGASVDDVAAAAGYTKGAVYSHFSSKADLFLGIYQARVEEARLDPKKVVAPPDPDDAFLGAALERTRTDPWLLLSYELLLFGMRHPEHREQVGQIYSDMLTIAVDALDRPEPGDDPAAAAARRTDLLDSVLVGTAVAHTLTMLNTLGVHGVDHDAVLRLLRSHWPLTEPPRDGTHQRSQGA